MKLRKRDLFLLVAAPALMLGAIGTVGGVKAAAEPTMVNAEDTTTYTFTKITSQDDLTDGIYLIGYETGNLIFDGSKTTLDASENGVSVTFSSSALAEKSAGDYSKYAFNIKSVTGGYTIVSASGKSIGNSKDQNKLETNKTYTNTITIGSNGDADIVCSSSHLRYNATSGQERFRYFKSSTYTSQKAIQLYKGTPVDTLEKDFSETTALRNLAFTYDSTVNEETGETTYSNFANVKMQFHYELPSQFVNGHGKDLDDNEKGLFVTDDANFEFKTKTSIEVAEGKVGKCYKNEETGEKGATYTVGIMIPESKFDTKLYTRTYIKKNGKYMWGKENTAYSVLDMVAAYTEDETISEEGRKICKAFGDYILEIA